MTETQRGAERSFSVHMVHVQWDPVKRCDLEVIDGGAVPLDPVKPGIWQGTLYSYGRMEDGRIAQFAIRAIRESEPELLRNGVTPTKMKQLVSRTDGAWWVEDEEWSRSGKFFGFQSGRGLGTIEILVSGQRCMLRVLPDGFSEEEIEDLFDSYDDAIQLILAKSSSTFIPLDWKPNDELEALLRQFVVAANRAIDRPVAGLVRGAALVRSDRVRPTLESTVAEAKRPGARLVAAPHVVESLDVPENGYLLHCIQQIHLRLRWAIERADRVRRTADTAATRIKEKLDHEFGTAELPEGELRVRIDLNRYERALRNDRKRMERIQQNLTTCPPIPGGAVRELTFTVKKKWERGDDRFYVILPDNSEARLVFPSAWNVTEREMYWRARYWLKARVIETQPTDREANFRASVCWEICQVLEIRDLGLEEHAARLERLRHSNGFVTPENQDQYKAYFSRRVGESVHELGRCKVAESAASRWRSLESTTRAAIHRLSGVRSRHKLPQSIVFNLKRDYRAVVRLYAHIAALWNLEREADYAHDGTERRGVARASDVYERWCLVELLSVLTDRFGFSGPLESGWIQRLTTALECDRRSRERVTLTLTNSLWDVTCKLDYEMKLAAPNHPGELFPDIRLEVMVGNTVLAPEDAGKSSVFLLDAKFRKFWRSLPRDRRHANETNSVSEVLKETVGKYSGLGWGTYILHPSPSTIPEPVSLSEWADSCTYGGSCVFDWEDTPPSHRHGAVLLRPGRDRDDLRRLVVMLMHASRFYSFCSGCGRRLKIAPDLKRGVGLYGKCDESGCELQGIPVVVTRCFACKERLVKLGPYWTYHDFAYDPGYNMVCPSCGTPLPRI